MKRKLVFFTVLVQSFFILSCAALAPATGHSVTPLRWSIGEYTNEWGDRLGRFFVQFDGERTATLTNAGGTQDLWVRDISFSHHQGFYFRVHTIMAANFSADEVVVILRNFDGTENVFNGTRGTSLRPFVVVPASDELLNALMENIESIRVTSLPETRFRFHFQFPGRFPEAFERLTERESR